MRPVSAQFLATLRVPHVVAFETELELPDAEPLLVNLLAGGSLTLDRSAQVRRTGQAQVPWSTDPDALELAGVPADLRLAPFGGMLRPRRGIAYANRTSELVELGNLRVDAVSWQTAQGTASVQLVDRMAQVADERLLTPYSPTVGAAAAIVELVEQVFGATIGYHVSTPASSPIVDAAYTDDRARAVSELARSIGAEVYFDAAGDLVVAPLPSVTDEPVWTIDAGTEGVLIDADEQLERAGVVNGVLVRGRPDAESPPLEALVTNDDPTSPLRYGGPFGQVVLVVESEAVQTVEQAAAAAAAQLDTLTGLARTVTLNAVPNPALEPGDVVEVVFPDGRVERHLLDAVSIPLDPVGPVQLASRAVFLPDALRSSPREVRTTRDLYRALAGARMVRA